MADLRTVDLSIFLLLAATMLQSSLMRRLNWSRRFFSLRLRVFLLTHTHMYTNYHLAEVMSFPAHTHTLTHSHTCTQTHTHTQTHYHLLAKVKKCPADTHIVTYKLSLSTRVVDYCLNSSLSKRQNIRV